MGAPAQPAPRRGPPLSEQRGDISSFLPRERATGETTAAQQLSLSQLSHSMRVAPPSPTLPPPSPSSCAACCPVRVARVLRGNRGGFRRGKERGMLSATQRTPHRCSLIKLAWALEAAAATPDKPRKCMRDIGRQWRVCFATPRAVTRRGGPKLGVLCKRHWHWHRLGSWW